MILKLNNAIGKRMQEFGGSVQAPPQTTKYRVTQAQYGSICCIRELDKYLETDNSHLVTDYRHNLLLL